MIFFLTNLDRRSIFFDGYLPPSKLEIRVDRMMTNTSRLCRLYELFPQRCPTFLLQMHQAQADIDLFKAHARNAYPTIDPSFLVPAVLDALRESDRYRAVTHLVPGEADHFCASDVSHHGGIILTSDSDLLVHDLGHGRVMFFRDLQQDAQSKLEFVCFSPRQLFEQLGLRYPELAVRLAYEQKCSPRANLAQLVKTSAQTTQCTSRFLAFQKEYASTEPLSFRQTWAGFEMGATRGLDPRISEIILDFHLKLRKGAAGLPVRMFLPPLLERPTSKSAWDQSTAIRQLAYSLLSYCTDNEIMVSSVQEYRRVQNLNCTGRRVELMQQKVAEQYMHQVLLCAAELETLSSDLCDLFWIGLAILLDKVESQRQDTASTAEQLHRFLRSQESVQPNEGASWMVVHGTAQLHGALYSLRILQQVLLVVGDSQMDQAFPLEKTRALLSRITPLERYPQTAEMVQIAQKLQDMGMNNLIDSICAKLPDANHGPEKA